MTHHRALPARSAATAATLAIAGLVVLAGCGADGAAQSAVGDEPSTSLSAPPASDHPSTGSGADRAGDRDLPPVPGDTVRFVHPTTTTTTTTTTSTTTSTTTTVPTTTSSTTTTPTTTTPTTTTSTTTPPPTTVRCSFAADASFAAGSADVEPGVADELDDLISAVGTNVDRVIVEGYTDHRGDADVNQRLSEDRAEAIAALLIDAGVDPSTIEVIGHGETAATQPNGNGTPDAATMAADRRVDVSFEADVPVSVTCPT